MLWYNVVYGWYRWRSSIKDQSLDLEAKSGHADLVLFDCGFALLLGVFGLREEHAVIASSLLGFADTAGLKRTQ